MIDSMISVGRAFSLAIGYALLGCAVMQAQSTQGLLAGRVLDEVTSGPVFQADVILSGEDSTRTAQSAKTDKDGYFSFASLEPGTYNLRIIAKSYRPSEVRGLSLAVSGLLIQNVTIRLLTDMWQTGVLRSVFPGNQSSILPVYGPDIDLSRSAYIEHSPEIRGELTPSLSRNATYQEMLNLPLAGRDPYALVVLQPNVTNDVGTQRGLGVSANGQRPSSTAFLLDGFQNNNYLTTGVFAVLPPEAIQEYRISINNFSAEFGGTSGYIANAITPSGSNAWHVQTYADLTNQSWNSENVQDKTAGGPAPGQQLSAGGVAEGHLKRNAVFTTTSLGWQRARNSEAPQPYNLPTNNFLRDLRPGTNAESIFTRFPGPIAPGSGDLGSLLLRPTVSINQIDALERIDFVSKDGRNHSFARLIADRFSQPDFIWTPYPAFRSGLDRNETGVAFSDILTPHPDWSEEFRAGVTHDSIGWNRAQPEIPLLVVPTLGFTFGSPASFTFHNAGTTAEVATNFAFTKGSHAARWGASFLERWPNSQLTTPGAPIEYSFQNLQDLLSDDASTFSFPASRAALESGSLTLPDFAREYRYWQFAGYLQDTYRLSEKFLINIGVRYEYFSPPANIGPQEDTLVQLGAGASMPERIQQANDTPGRQLYSADRKDWAPRFGFAYNPRKNSGLVLRGSYGIFYDRPFDNLWLDASLNDSLPESENITGKGLNYLNAPSVNLRLLSAAQLSASTIQGMINYGNSYVDQTLFQPGFRSPYVQSFFTGLQERFSRSISMEVDYAGSLGRELVTTDVINRTGSTCRVLFGRSICTYRYNDAFGDLDYRGNQGSSNHNALVSSLLIRQKRLSLTLNYTFSHTIDNQSEPLAGFAANLAAVNLTGVPITLHQAAFTEQFNSGVDRGNSDFDERHVLNSYFTFDIPSPSADGRLKRLLSNWMMAGVAAIRSGSPFTVYAVSDTSNGLVNNRSDLVDPNNARADLPYPGGKLILNPAAFLEPAPGTLGSAGRNAFYGPGAYNFDVSISRIFALRGWERTRLTVRADAFNLLNHANLSNPASGSDECCGITPAPFGLALYGRNETSAAIPLATPLSETAREIHFVLRLTF